MNQKVSKHIVVTKCAKITYLKGAVVAQRLNLPGWKKKLRKTTPRKGQGKFQTLNEFT